MALLFFKAADRFSANILHFEKTGNKTTLDGGQNGTLVACVLRLRLCWIPVGQTQEHLDFVSERKQCMAISHIKFIRCNCYMTQLIW